MEFFGYIQSYDKYFWQWEDNAEVMAIPAGSTIAYEKFILEIMEPLVPQGLPPFGSLLLAIIATNPNGEASFDIIKNRIAKALNITDSKNITTLDEAISFLKLLATLPKQYKHGKKRILVYQAIFEGCHNIVALKNSQRIYDYYTELKHSREKLIAKKEFNQAVFHRDFRTIGLLGSKFKTVQDIIDKVASLPEMPEGEIELDETDVDEKIPDDFIEQLIHNAKTFHVGSLVKRIWGGINIPVHSVLPSQQPLGGISDLTNKGDLDKLLISEFAHDDLVFLSRLANNEALYIQREIPPANNKLQRVILIDASLKNWGTPKAIAFGTMLAIAKHPKTDIECSTFVIGEQYHTISIDTVDNVIDGLQILEGSLHCANGLASFFKDFPNHDDREVFLITTPSTLKQVAMLKAVNDYHAAIKYWIYTDAEGGIDVYKKQQNSKKHLQRIQLPLGELWEKATAKNIEPDKRAGKSSSYPILFRSATNPKKTCSTSDGEIFQITTEHTLLRLHGNTGKPSEKGWELVYENLPFISGELEMGVTKKGEYILLMFNPQNKEINLLNVNTGTNRTVVFKEWRSSIYNQFIFLNENFYYLTPSSFWTIDRYCTISKNEKESAKLFSKYKERENELKKLVGKYYQTHSVFKHVSDVYINDADQLVLKHYAFHLNQGHHLKISSTSSLNRKTTATKKGDHQYVFEEGSCVEVHQSGMLILKSANHHLSEIYIPCVLHASIAAATDNTFAGNMYYYKNPSFQIILSSCGPNKLVIVEALKKLLDIGLQEAVGIVDSLPAQLFSQVPKARALEIKSILEQQRAEVEIKSLSNSQDSAGEAEVITTDLFMTRYIQPFIHNILSHGAKNKTASKQ